MGQPWGACRNRSAGWVLLDMGWHTGLCQADEGVVGGAGGRAWDKWAEGLPPAGLGLAASDPKLVTFAEGISEVRGRGTP